MSKPTRLMAVRRIIADLRRHFDAEMSSAPCEGEGKATVSFDGLSVIEGALKTALLNHGKSDDDSISAKHRAALEDIGKRVRLLRKGLAAWDALLKKSA